MRYRFLRYPGGLGKAVTLSYDDGVCHDVRLAETCSSYGVKCTFNINSGLMAEKEGEFRLTAAAIKKHILDAGHEVAVHGHIHRAPGAGRAIDVARDVLDDRRGLEEAFGIIVRGMAYPDSGITRMQPGMSYEAVRTQLAALDIAYSRTLAGDNNSFALPTDWYAWMPTCHHNNPHAMEWAQQFASLDMDATRSAGRFARLFYLWGHSYEFANDNNWEHLEALLATLGGRQDTWYATNGQIHDYVQAWSRMETSADGKRIYNPTLHTLWLDVDGRLYSVASGETLVLEE